MGETNPTSLSISTSITLDLESSFGCPGIGLPKSALVAMGTEHRLADAESLGKMLKTVEKGATS
jgi:hypothetical protein